MAKVSSAGVQKGVSNALGVVASGVAIAGVATQIKALAFDKKTFSQALDLPTGTMLLASGGIGAVTMPGKGPLVDAVKIIDLVTATYGAAGVLYNVFLVPQGFPEFSR